MTNSAALNTSVTVQLDADGNGSTHCGPLSARENWLPDNVYVRVSSNVKEAECTIYAGEAAEPAFYRDQTFAGSTGDSSSRVNGDTIRVGSAIWAIWTGGDAGATATLTVTGVRTF